MKAEQRRAERTERARELLRTVRHAAMATVNADGSPHNSPYFFMAGPGLEHLYWGSHPESLHSQNILRTGQLFVVLYDAIERGGLFIEAGDGHILEGEELDDGLAVHNALRAREGQEPIGREYYVEGPQRMWGARTKRFWVNASERDDDGGLVRDYRLEVRREDLV
ncbi:MAG: hypothetical protein K0S68_179 [Candidatus Saccharibacteria bacterium]|jgi:hypothetical protein|nr:hypothetical protein [Candidatus Saccharibacteria bacterium]